MTTASLPPFVENSSAHDAHQALKKAVTTMDQAKDCAVIWFQEMVSRKLYKDLGYASIYLYADHELGFSAAKTTNFLKLSKTLNALPLLKKELAEGEIGYTKACEIIKVANPDNIEQWLDQARTTPRRELVKKVAKAKKAAQLQHKTNPDQGNLLAPPKRTTPVVAIRHRVVLDMSTEEHARYELLREKLHKLGHVPAGGSVVEQLLAGLASLVESSGDGETGTRAPAQIHVRRCPECKSATITTRGREVPLSESEFDRLSCDAQIIKPGRPNRATIKPSIKREVLSRDKHHCQAPGCRNTWFLEIHHIVPRRLGGTNDLTNLITLCGCCHSYLHEKGRRDFRLPFEKTDRPSVP